MSDELPKIRRPAIRPLDEWVDDFMRGFGVQTIDPAKPETLTKLRAYTRGWLRNCLTHTVLDLQRGSKRGIEQSLDFMFDPRHAEIVKKNRKERFERKVQKKIEEQHARTLKERERIGRVQ